MLKEFVEKIASMAENKTYEIGGSTYSDHALTRIEPHIDAPRSISMSSLDSAVKLIKNEINRLNTKIFVHVENARHIKIFTTYDKDFSRNYLYSVECDTPMFKEGFRPQQTALIELRSKFIENEGSQYLLGLLSKITNENSVSSTDNGVTQTVEAKQGIALAAKVAVKPRIELVPFRTFLEVKQPSSEFLLRLSEGGDIGLFEADGGMWQLEAKKNIKEYFEEELVEFLNSSRVIVMI